MGDLGSIPVSVRPPGERKGCPLQYSWASLVAQTVKNLSPMWETWVRKIPWRREMLPTPVFLPGEFHGRGAWRAVVHGVSKSCRRLSTHTQRYTYRYTWGFHGGSVVDIPPAKQETQGRSMSRKDPLENGMATHSTILAWRIPWTEEPGRLQFMAES